MKRIMVTLAIILGSTGMIKAAQNPDSVVARREADAAINALSQQFDLLQDPNRDQLFQLSASIGRASTQALIELSSDQPAYLLSSLFAADPLIFRRERGETLPLELLALAMGFAMQSRWQEARSVLVDFNVKTRICSIESSSFQTGYVNIAFSQIPAPSTLCQVQAVLGIHEMSLQTEVEDSVRLTGVYGQMQALASALVGDVTILDLALRLKPLAIRFGIPPSHRQYREFRIRAAEIQRDGFMCGASPEDVVAHIGDMAQQLLERPSLIQGGPQESDTARQELLFSHLFGGPSARESGQIIGEALVRILTESILQQQSPV
ncbi:MAG: hypothetical protein LBJ92_03610 [Holosporales bacterium]|nr:hypothetical protein [Holosporales bacterium]